MSAEKYQTPDPSDVDRSPTEARQASKQGVVRYVLAASLALIVVAMAIIYFSFA